MPTRANSALLVTTEYRIPGNSILRVCALETANCKPSTDTTYPGSHSGNHNNYSYVLAVASRSGVFSAGGGIRHTYQHDPPTARIPTVCTSTYPELVKITLRRTIVEHHTILNLEHSGTSSTVDIYIIHTWYAARVCDDIIVNFTHMHSTREVSH